VSAAGQFPRPRPSAWACATASAAGGFTLFAARLLAGATASVGSGGLVAAWMPVAGTGSGLATARVVRQQRLAAGSARRYVRSHPARGLARMPYALMLHK